MTNDPIIFLVNKYSSRQKKPKFAIFLGNCYFSLSRQYGRPQLPISALAFGHYFNSCPCSPYINIDY